jgi:hypothetical protein
MAKSPIGERDEAWLAKFVDRAIANQIGANLPPSLVGEEIHATTKLKVDDDIELSESAINKLKTLLGIP